MREKFPKEKLGLPPEVPPGPAPVVAIVGRPNVGKSTLVNRLCKKRVAIVADQPGMTRDRVYAQTTLRDRPVVLVDTGGFDIDPNSPLVDAIRAQLFVAVEEADVIVCLFDGASSPNQLDEEVVSRLRRSGKPVVFAANKTESMKRERAALEYHELAVEQLHMISAAHGDGIGELLDIILGVLPSPDEIGGGDFKGEGIRLAVMGRPNAGKSTLVNTLLGVDRMIVDDVPGTTRDAVQHSITYKGKPWVLIDTAGMRRRRSIGLIAEELSVLHAVKAMSLADVVLMLIDVTEEIADQDLRIANLAIKRGRGLVVGLNKWDIAGEKPELEFAKPFSDAGTLHFIPVERLSGKESWNLDKVFALVERVANNRKRHIATGKLNRFVEKLIHDHQPPAYRHKPVTVKYATQVADSPPTFALFSNRPEGFGVTYRRYLENRFRDAFDFEGVPIRIVFKKKGKDRKKR